MKYTFEQIKNSLPIEKRKMDPLVAHLLGRPLSFVLAYFFINLGMTAWLVSFMSVIVVFSGCMLICIDSNITRWIGLGLVYFWTLLDGVDGNIARVTKTQSNKGAFMDAQSGYYTCAFLYLAYGMAAFHTSNGRIFSNPVIFVFLGAFASLSDILSRLIYQKYVSAVENTNQNSDATSKQSSVNKIRKRISTEVGITGFAPIGGFLAQVFIGYDFLVLIYFVFCSMTLLLTTTYYSLKAHRE